MNAAHSHFLVEKSKNLVYNHRMVVRRTVENLRERSKEERTAIATWIALSVVAILFIAWVIYFFHSIATTPVPDLQSAPNASASSGLQQAQQPTPQAYSSTTQFINVEGTVETQQFATSTGPSQ